MGNTMGRGVLLVFCAIFAVVFGAGGYWAGLRPLAETALAAWTVRSWQPVPAQVLDVQLKQHAGSEGGTAYQVLARYRYTVGGQTYEAQRVGLDRNSSADNVGDWQAQWHRNLRQAQERGESITAWVNPQAPAQALLDRSIRWRLQIFRLPFALVFTGVGVTAAWMFLRILRRPQDDVPDLEPTHSLAKGQGALWFFAVFWCGIAFPMAALFWSDGKGPWWAKGFMGVFVVIGVGLVAAAWQNSRKAWRYQGVGMTALPSRPTAGRSVEITLVLPARAVQQAGAENMRLQVAQYRVDESSSGSPERQVEVLQATARRQPTGEGGMRLVARFDLPDDAPTHSARRGGERVDWRLELVRADGALELAYELAVQAVTPSWAEAASVPDRFDRRAQWEQEVPIEPPALGRDAASQPWDSLGTMKSAESPGFFPPGVRLSETPDAWSLAFEQTAWRWSAAVALALLALEWWVNDRIQPGALVLPSGFWGWLALLVLPAWALHAATRRWTLRVQDDGLVVRRGSWVWSRVATLPGESSQSLVHKLQFTAGTQAYHAVLGKDVSGHLQTLTPGLSGTAAAQAVGQAAARAWLDRRGRFTPGAQRPQVAAHSRPAWGGWAWLLAFGVLLWWAHGGRAVWWAGRSAVLQAPAAVASSRIWAPADARLMDAQNAGDASALAQALRDGANPNLLADSGSSVLMLAAHRGQLAHVEALLQAGAQPDLRQTAKDSERGDTALLRAFYGGHLVVAQRLVQAGASLQARNRWDWGPVHMAAQCGCVPCLDWLKEQGQSLTEPAPASRGETPAMLAAAKGKVAVLRWLDEQGVDLSQKDPHGKSALDWARWGGQQAAQDWLEERARPR